MKAGLKVIDGKEIPVYINGNTNIVQSNYMINHKEHWTVAEERLFMTALSMVNREDKALHLYKIPVKTFVELWGVDPKSVYTEVIAVLEGLSKKGIYRKDKYFDVIPALTRAVYDKGEQYALVQIHPDLQKHIISIKENGGYTRYKLENAIRLNRAKAGTTTNRIYELCRSYARAGKTVVKEISVKDLKKALDLSEKYKEIDGVLEVLPEKYKRLGDFEKKVLGPAMPKINENTDIQVFYEISGRGKKAVVKFTVTLVEPEPVEDVPEAVPDQEPVPASPLVPEWQAAFYADMPEDWRDDYKELICGCHEMIQKLVKAGIEFTPLEMKLLANHARSYGANIDLEYFDYFDAQQDAVLARLDSKAKSAIKNKKAYAKSAFKGNYGNWTPGEWRRE